MIKSVFTLLISLVSIFSYAQESREISSVELENIVKQVNKEAEKYKFETQKQASRHCVAYRQLEIEFEVDTFKIEQIQRKKIEIDYSTAGMLSSTYTALQEYDVLLNKYYILLSNQLNSNDLEVLKKTQRNWIAYRDSEIELINSISKEEYSGGGTIQSMINASRILNLTQHRVVELFEYSRLILE